MTGNTGYKPHVCADCSFESTRGEWHHNLLGNGEWLCETCGEDRLAEERDRLNQQGIEDEERRDRECLG